MKEIVRVKSAPGLHWKKRRNDIFEARWQCRDDLVKRPDFKDFKVKSVKLWSGAGDPTLEEWQYIADTCGQLQQEMLVWAHGGLPSVVPFNGTLSGLIHCYHNDPDSPYRKPGKLRYASRSHYDVIMRLLEREHGNEAISEIKGRTIQRWYDDWSVCIEASESDKGKKKRAGGISAAHTRVKILRLLLNFGAAFLEDEHCIRLSGVLSKMKFAMAKPRSERLTAEQATAIRAKAHEMGRPSIALAQAFQFELMLRQKDVIGEWVPVSEPGMSDVLDSAGLKWLRGIRWEEIDQNLVLTHVTSKRNKEIRVNLRNAPMVVEELDRQFVDRPASGPIVISEFDKLPWTAPEFRRWWRLVADACDVPRAVRNMDSRAGAISEATDAGAELEHVRHAATHSDIAMTQRYSRGQEGKIEQVQKARLEHRNKSRTE